MKYGLKDVKMSFLFMLIYAPHEKKKNAFASRLNLQFNGRMRHTPMISSGHHFALLSIQYSSGVVRTTVMRSLKNHSGMTRGYGDPA